MEEEHSQILEELRLDLEPEKFRLLLKNSTHQEVRADQSKRRISMVLFWVRRDRSLQTPSSQTKVDDPQEEVDR